MLQRLPSLLIILGLSLTIYALQQKENSKLAKTAAPPPQNISLPASSSATSSHSMKTNTTSAFSQKNMLTMMEFMKSSTFEKDNLPQTLNRLNAMNLQPTYIKDQNPSTGALHIIRSEKALPGTRYFHAQYFSDGKNTPYLQHMSFDIPPGPQSLQIAAENLKTMFPHLTNPVIQKPDFIMWKWKNGYNVWLMRLRPQQLTSDPFSAYDSQDEGTIKIAMELDVPHEH